MTSHIKRKPVALAIGAALVGTLAVAGTASASAFTVSDLAHGYSQFMAEGKCGEGKCGGDGKGSDDKGKEGKCGEGKCGGSK